MQCNHAIGQVLLEVMLKSCYTGTCRFPTSLPDNFSLSFLLLHYSLFFSTWHIIFHSDFPSIPDRLRVRDKFISYHTIIESIQCPLSNGSNVRYKWYKNGIDITRSSSNSTGYLRYWTPNDEPNVGIFQCFAENGIGSDHAIVRVLHRGDVDIMLYCMLNNHLNIPTGFSNPPANFTCQAQDQSLDINSPPVALLGWAPPNLDTNPIRTYIIEYNGEGYSTNNTFFEINLKYDQLNVRFNVYVNNSFSPLRKNGASTSCEIQSTLERRTCEFSVVLYVVHYVQQASQLASADRTSRGALEPADTVILYSNPYMITTCSDSVQQQDQFYILLHTMRREL